MLLPVLDSGLAGQVTVAVGVDAVALAAVTGLADGGGRVATRVIPGVGDFQPEAHGDAGGPDLDPAVDGGLCPSLGGAPGYR
jgi:hypothetical protein